MLSTTLTPYEVRGASGMRGSESRARTLSLPVFTETTTCIAPLVAIDSRLRYATDSKKFKENVQLTRLDSDEPFPAPLGGLQSVA